MSSRVEFYIKDIKRDDKFVYLDGYSRDSYVYAAFDSIVGNNIEENFKCKVLKFDKLEEIEQSLKDHKQVIITHIKELNNKKEDILKMNNSVSEKKTALEIIYDEMEEEKFELDELEGAIAFYNILWGVSNYGGNRVYAGIEGINPDGSEDVNEERDK